MSDYSNFPAPREVPLRRRLEIEDRRKANRNVIFGMLALAGLCFVIGAITVTVVPLANGHPLVEFSPSANAAQASPTTRATSVRTSAASAATLPAATLPANTQAASTGPSGTPVPYGRSLRADNGLKVTLTSFQRPLPAQGVKVPAGQELALVSLRIENTKTSGTLKVKPSDFQLVTPEGEQYNPTVGGVTTGSMLAATDLEAGKIVEGDLIFYVFSDVQDMNLLWKAGDGVNRLFAVTRAR